MNAVKQYWDVNVDNWKVANHLPKSSPEFFQEVERYRFDKLNYLTQAIDYTAFSGQKVLDVGCGLATDTSMFARNGAQITGIDIAPRAVSLAKENFRQRGLSGQFHVMDGQSMTFEENSFDFVYCHTVLHFANDPAQMVQEIHRVLKPGGRALLMVINRRSWLYFMHKFAGMPIDYMDAPVFHKLSPRDFDEIVSIFNLRRIEMYRFPVRTEVHKGVKAVLYNTFFVDAFNALPRSITGKTGYHMIAFVEKQTGGNQQGKETPTETVVDRKESGNRYSGINQLEALYGEKTT